MPSADYLSQLGYEVFEVISKQSSRAKCQCIQI